ncbi:unnamed protein product [Prorocentrum cordatum]|uniref:RNA-editing substrate-binding complex 6 protein domain-containing protein n=1 Tax=Prorocentrum cordatum TaxID=2364126 RepID=A0ABN9TQ12_9DINO|nr:unnamed protein product [Polarella glacialis]
MSRAAAALAACRQRRGAAAAAAALQPPPPPPAPGAAVASQRPVRGSLAELERLARQASEGARPAGSELARAAAALTQELRTEPAAFRSADMLQIVGACCRASHRHPPLMEAAAAHVLRGMQAYPLFEGDGTAQLSPVDIACLVFAYAHCGHQAGALLEACAERLKACHMIGGPNCATILNSYARLSECNPELFKLLAVSIIQTRPESFEVHHLSITMNAFARCQVRKPQLFNLLGGFLQRRVEELSPQNVSNVAHAFAKLECYNHDLFAALQGQVLSGTLGAYKNFELAVLTHSMAKLGAGGRKLYGALFEECARRAEWSPRAVAQILDAMRRRQAYFNEALALLLLRQFVEGMRDYPVHPLTQTAWCLVELNVLDMADRLQPLLPEEAAAAGGAEVPEGAGSAAARQVMREVFERMESLSGARPLTPTQTCYVQQLVRSYHSWEGAGCALRSRGPRCQGGGGGALAGAGQLGPVAWPGLVVCGKCSWRAPDGKYEVDYRLQPAHVRAFCKSLFVSSTSVVSSVGRGGRAAGARARALT